MPTKDAVLRWWRHFGEGPQGYEKAAERLGIPPGQAYLIATGVPADGSDLLTNEERERSGLLPAPQDLVNPPHENPTKKEHVLEWLRARAAADLPMREAARKAPLDPPPVKARPDDDLTAALGREHNRLMSVVEVLLAIPSHDRYAPIAQVDRRGKVASSLCTMVRDHVAVEGDYLWPTVRADVAQPDGWLRRDEAVHLLAAVADVEQANPDTDEFDARVTALAKAVRLHVALVDELSLPLRDQVGEDRLAELGSRVHWALTAGLTGGPRQDGDPPPPDAVLPASGDSPPADAVLPASVDVAVTSES